MTHYYYSASENAFFPAVLEEQYKKAGTFPDDAREVDADVAVTFIGNPPDGKIRIAGSDGMPRWGDIPPPTHAEIIAEAEREKQRRIDVANEFMNNKQWPGKAAIGRLKGDELAQYNLWLDYLDALELVDTSSAPDNEWPTPPAVQAR
ncbi:tail fiber assembly protein [Escherichia coli]|uniref:tail fiber assembly protein n=1 Tax=Escherichia coli TaxID=562 RepID=UPI000589F619|nr:tail fiber assembly protein [Escherichia coli]KIH35889.1 hypothetical protein PD07_12360 [Escherichia coli]